MSETLAERFGEGMVRELPEPLPRLVDDVHQEVAASPALARVVRRGELGIRTRRIPILVGNGTNADAALNVPGVLAEQRAVPRFVGSTSGDGEGHRASRSRSR